MKILPCKYQLCCCVLSDTEYNTVTYSSNPILNLSFAMSFIFCVYFYAMCMLEDPGYVPNAGSRTQQKAVVDELLSLWKFDDQNFCVSCMVRMPLRSKHCRRCARCVAKQDQWVFLPTLGPQQANSLVIVPGSIVVLEQITTATSPCMCSSWRLGFSFSLVWFYDVCVHSSFRPFRNHLQH